MSVLLSCLGVNRYVHCARDGPASALKVAPLTPSLGHGLCLAVVVPSRGGGGVSLGCALPGGLCGRTARRQPAVHGPRRHSPLRRGELAHPRAQRPPAGRPPAPLSPRVLYGPGRSTPRPCGSVSYTSAMPAPRVAGIPLPRRTGPVHLAAAPRAAFPVGTQAVSQSRSTAPAGASAVAAVGGGGGAPSGGRPGGRCPSLSSSRPPTRIGK